MLPRPSHDYPGPVLVPTPDRRPDRRPTAVALWHLLSLDAPTVAALWTLFLARSVHLTLPWTTPAAIFTAVWMIYAADRLLDSRPQHHHTPLEARHRFHHLHRTHFLTAIVLAAILLIALLHQIDALTLHLFTLLAVLLGAWMLLIHAGHVQNAHRLPKELAVGLFFPTAVLIPTIALNPASALTLLPSALLFAALCTLNCLYLYAWEHPKANRTQPTAHLTTLWATQHLIPLTTALLAISLATALFAPHTPALACALSSALLLLLHKRQTRMSSLHLRAAADLVLLTPVLLTPVLLTPVLLTPVLFLPHP